MPPTAFVHDMDGLQTPACRAAGVRLIGQARHLQQLRPFPVGPGHGVLQGVHDLFA